MKSFWILSVLLLVLNITYATEWELDEGSKEIGGSFSIESRTGDLHDNRNGDGYISIIFAPTFQIFLIQRFSAGGKLAFRGWGRGSNTNSEIVAGPALTYYFGSNRDSYWLFVGSNFLIEAAKDVDSKITSLQLLGGVMFRIVDNFVLKANLNYTIDRRRTKGWSDSDAISGNTLGIRFGFSGFTHKK